MGVDGTPNRRVRSQLRSENASLKRQLAGDDVVDLRDGDASPPAKKRNALRDAHDDERVIDSEQRQGGEGRRRRGARPHRRRRGSGVGAAASASADAREAAEAAQELEDVHDDFVNPLTLTVNALQTKIDELHALAYQVDPVAIHRDQEPRTERRADAIKKPERESETQNVARRTAIT